MALSDAALVVGSTAIKNAISHAQAHSGARGANGTTNVVGSRVVGGMGCGECWESVIRADEREHIQLISGRLGKCVSCDHPLQTQDEATD